MIQTISRAALWVCLPRPCDAAAIAQPFACVANLGSGNISGHSVDAVTGALTGGTEVADR
jgi:hypothetical protein